MNKLDQPEKSNRWLRLRRPSPAMAVALIALFVALGGTAGAAALITGKQIKNGTVAGIDVRNGSLTGLDVKDRSLTPTDFTGSVQGPAGPPGRQGLQGAQGVPGPKGDPGAPGATNVVVRTHSFGTPTPPGSWVGLRPMCDAGERAVGGGAGFSGNGGNEELQQSFPVEADLTPPENGDTPVGWFSLIRNNNTVSLVATAYAVCARP